MPGNSVSRAHTAPREGRTILALPHSSIAWIALALGAFALAWGFLSPSMVRIPIPGGSFLPSAAAAIASFALGMRALIKEHERSLLLWIAVVATGVFALFAVAFVFGEVFVGHS